MLHWEDPHFTLVKSFCNYLLFVQKQFLGQIQKRHRVTFRGQYDRTLKNRKMQTVFSFPFICYLLRGLFWRRFKTLSRRTSWHTSQVQQQQAVDHQVSLSYATFQSYKRHRFIALVNKTVGVMIRDKFETVAVSFQPKCRNKATDCAGE